MFRNILFIFSSILVSALSVNFIFNTLIYTGLDVSFRFSSGFLSLFLSFSFIIFLWPILQKIG